RAIADAPVNPRVKLVVAMLRYFRPTSTRLQKDSALVEWRRAAESFTSSDFAATPWGDAEGWAWLGGAYLADGKPSEAKDALDRALAIRPDFWWARTIALPQAANSRLR